MRKVVMYTSGASGESLGHDIACFDRMSDMLAHEVAEGLVEQVTLVVRDTWDVVEIEKYGMLMKRLSRLPVFTEVYLEGRINLATLDMFTAGLDQEGAHKARRRFDEEPDALRLSSSLQISLEAMPDDWVPLNGASSFLWSLGDKITETTAEEIYDIYSNPAFCTLDISMVSEGYLERAGGSNVRLLGRAEKGWAVGAMPLGRDPMYRDNRISVAS